MSYQDLSVCMWSRTYANGWDTYFFAHLLSEFGRDFFEYYTEATRLIQQGSILEKSIGFLFSFALTV